MVYGSDTKLSVEINTPTWRQEHFNEEDNQEELRCVAHLVEELWKIAHIQEYAAK